MVHIRKVGRLTTDPAVTVRPTVKDHEAGILCPQLSRPTKLEFRGHAAPIRGLSRSSPQGVCRFIVFVPVRQWAPYPPTMRVSLKGFRRPSRNDPYRQVVVIFTRPVKDLRNFDVALGPCISLPGRSRPLVGVTNQEPGDARKYDELASLLLPDRGARAWETVVETDAGRLFTFSEPLVEAMAELNRESLRRGAERPSDYYWMFEPARSVMARWMPEVRWPDDPAGVPQRASAFMVVCAWARVSQERGQKLYCWSGPGFDPWVTSERVERLRAKVAAK